MEKIYGKLLSFTTTFIGIIVLLLCIFVLPQIAAETVRIHPEVHFLKTPILLGMYATAIPFFYALFETVKIIRIAERNSFFSEDILSGLNHIKVCAITILSLYVLGFILLNYSNALPPLIALMGIVIMIISTMVALGASFIKTQLKKVTVLANCNEVEI